MTSAILSGPREAAGSAGIPVREVFAGGAAHDELAAAGRAAELDKIIFSQNVDLARAAPQFHDTTLD